MHQFGGLLILALALLSLGAVADDHESEMVFDEGTVAIYCSVMEEDEVPERVFNAAFPGWISDLQGDADAGKIIRVHYLPKFRGGVFIVVDGEDLADARNNATEILEKHHAVLREAWAASEASAPPGAPCEMIEIGPVALLPR